MRVIRLNEAKMTVQEFNDSFNNSSIEDKLRLFVELYGSKISLNKLKKIFDYGNDFIIRWVEAFNPKELLNDNNEFIAFLSTCKEELPIFNSPNEFMKAYNSYAKGYFNINDLNNRSVLFQLLNNNNLYNFDDKDFKDVLRIRDYLSKKLGDGEDAQYEMRKIFFDNPDDPLDSKLNSLDTIKKLAGDDQSSTSTNNEVDKIDRMSDERFTEYVNQLLKSERLVNALKSII